jgi:glutamate decarboxylase
MENALYLSRLMEKHHRGNMLVMSDKLFMPVLAVRSIDPSFSVYDLSANLRETGWIVPAYTLPPNAEDVHVLRVVVKENFSRDMADMLVADMRKSYKYVRNIEQKNIPRGKNRSQPTPC